MSSRIAPAPSINPLSPLSPDEIKDTVKLIKKRKEYHDKVRIISITLKEPAKEICYKWRVGDVVDREAVAVLFDNSVNTGLDLYCNITQGKIIKACPHPPHCQPTISVDEMFECEAAVQASPLFKAALKKHYGDVDSSLVMVDIWSAGNYGTEEDKTNRLTRPLCFLRKETGENGYCHPIEGIRPVVNLNTMEVIRVEEYGVWPLPSESADYAAERMNPTTFRKDLKPLHITQPEGPSYALSGNHIAWQKWDMVIGFTGREGLVIHNVRYNDNGTVRPILFRASLSEMVVPYGDPQPQQARKNAFDVGEYGMGYCSNSLKLGCDCVGYINYLDGNLVDSKGNVVVIKNAICIHEEDFGLIWKHTDRRIPDAPEVRRSRRLVISSISTVENYEYGFFWYFYQDGNIQFEMKLTGILSLAVFAPLKEDETRGASEVKSEGTKESNSSAATAAGPIHGCMILPLLYAPNHQHFFNMRLDVGIDGSENTICQVDVVADEEDEEKNPFHNAFHAVSTPLKTELQACADLNLDTGRTWKFTNPNIKSRFGVPRAYKFMPGDNAKPFASKKAWWRKRAGFVDHHVWVTPFSENEYFAAGDFPNQSCGGDGLIAWTKADRSIENKDVVFWYTFGHNHIPRPEDSPVMPAAYIGFLLKPAGFFDENPSNDVGPSVSTHSRCGH